jgi:gluconolactonase
VIFAFDLQGAKPANMRLLTPSTMAGRHARRYYRQFVVQLKCAARLRRGAGVQSDRQADWTHQLPEVCANVAFGGPKRDRLFMTAGQSLYMLQVATQGAAPG